MRRKAIELVVVAVLSFTCSRASATVLYTMSDLGSLSGNHTYASGISGNGLVVGESAVGDSVLGYYQHAFLWQSGNGMQDLGTLGGTQSEALGVNNSGQVAGWSRNSGGSYRAFLWQSGSGMQNLGTLGGTQSWARGINNDGQVVGDAYTPNVGGVMWDHAFLWQSGSGMQDLGTLGGTFSSANAISNSGHVVGYADDGSGYSHAFLWQSGSGMQNLGTLPGCNQSQAYALNNNDQVVGHSGILINGQLTDLAFLWQSGTGMQSLGTLGGAYSEALGINDSGQVVGYAWTSTGASHAFVYDNGTMMDLNSLITPSSGWILDEATAINNDGAIVAWGHNGLQYHSFLLTPVPEPSSLLLLGVGAISVLAFAWRRRSLK